MKIRKMHIAGAAAAALLAGGVAVTGVALASPTGTTYSACLGKLGILYNVTVNNAPRCFGADTTITWSQTGPAGAAGPAGVAGATGPQGPAGPAGPAGTAAGFGTGTQTAVAGAGAQCTVGEVILTAGAVANGIPANGQLLPIADYAPLFNLLGTQYGGNGTTNFALPNLGAMAPDGLTYSICWQGVFPARS